VSDDQFLCGNLVRAFLNWRPDFSKESPANFDVDSLEGEITLNVIFGLTLKNSRVFINGIIAEHQTLALCRREVKHFVQCD